MRAMFKSVVDARMKIECASAAAREDIKEVLMSKARDVLRTVAKTTVRAVFDVGASIQSVWSEAHEEVAEAKRRRYTVFEATTHECKSPCCKCMIPRVQDFCNSFCAEVEEASSIEGCGCGHCVCDKVA